MTKNILLVEYDESTIQIVKELFPAPAFEVAVACDGETAKRLLQDRSFDLMITAAMLPRFHGFNLALAVSQEYPGIKIIVISAIYKGLEYRHQAITQYRANDFFEKPLERERLRGRVLELLGLSESDLGSSASAAATRVPVFDTAKIPAAKFAEEEGGKLSSSDIFGDIIQKIDQVPAFEIDLDDGGQAAAGKATPPAAPARKTEPPSPHRPAETGPHRPAPTGPSSPAQTEPHRPAQAGPDPGRTVLLKPPPAKAEPAPRAADLKSPLGGNLKGHTRVAAPSFDLDSLRPARKTVPSPDATSVPGAGSQRIDASLEGLRTQQAKPEVRQKEMRKIEDDIARKFEDTLSGLGLGKKPAPPRPAAPPPRPEPKTVIMPEIKAVPRPMAPPPVQQAPVVGLRDEIADEVIDLGEAAILKEEPAPPAMAPAVKPAVPPPPPAPPAPPAKPSVAPAAAAMKRGNEEAGEVREAKPEKTAPAADNPNEVGDYVLLGMIARGGMAEIYKAKKKGVKGFEKVIAIKKILSGYGEDDKYIEMLVDEAKIAAELSHPNIVQIYDLGRKDNYYFIAMEYVLGKDLREIQTRLRERDQWFPEEIAIHLTIKILEALNYAHKAKDSRGRSLDIVHRDVSPPNILISYSGDVKLTDFGVSKASIKIHQTLSGALKGKLLYMSPEQACGESGIDYRSDLYSAGVVLFELLTGKKLFLDTSEMLVLKKVQNGEIINPREINPDIDPALEKILLTSLSKECDKRYQSAAAMIADLEAYLHRKFDRAPGPVHLSHFIYGLFEGDIQREGIKVDLKPLPFALKVREVPKPPPAVEKAVPAVEPTPPPPPPPPVSAMPPPPPLPEGPVRISFDDDQAAPPGKKRPAADKADFKSESLFRELDKEKKKSPLLPLAALLLVGAVAAGLYFFVINKPAADPAAAGKNAAAQALKPGAAAGVPTPEEAAKQAEMKKIADELAATQKLLDEAKQKQEEELKKVQAEEERKKLLEERRKKTEADRLKQEEEERLKGEEAARLQREEEERRKQEEADRLKKAEEERRLAEEKKLAEMKRVKEGDIVPLNEVDAEPVAISSPAPRIPDSIRSSMADSQSVIFSVLINHNGDVETVRMLRKTNSGQLDSILTETVKSYKFQPARKDNLRVKVWKTIPMSIKK